MTGIKAYIKQHRVLLIVNAVLLVLYFLVTWIAKGKAEKMYSQQAAARWEYDGEIFYSGADDTGYVSGDEVGGKLSAAIHGYEKAENMPYAQVSAFISPGRNVGVDGVNNVRSSIQETLVKDSYAESKTGGRVWIDAYSGETEINLRKDSNTLSVTAVGVGGDFFQFHPMTLLSGSYISESDLNHDRILVDENFAWAMFGSNDIVGMQVWLDESIYFIAGVVKVEEDTISQMAYGNGNRVYMSYEELNKHQENLPITCYELVFPNPISNYAYYALRSAWGLSEESSDTMDKKENPLSFDDVEVIENTNRYETMELITKVNRFRLRSMRTSPLGYPFWENIAREQDDEQMLYLILRGLLLICPIISLIVIIYGLWEKRTWTVKGFVVGKISEVRNKRAWKAYEKKMAEQDMQEDDEALDSEDDEEQDGDRIEQEMEEDLVNVDEMDGSSTGNDVELRSVTGVDWN